MRQIGLSAQQPKNSKIAACLDPEQPLVFCHAPRLQIVYAPQDQPRRQAGGIVLDLIELLARDVSDEQTEMHSRDIQTEVDCFRLRCRASGRSFSSIKRISSGGAPRGRYQIFPDTTVRQKVLLGHPRGNLVSTVYPPAWPATVRGRVGDERLHPNRLSTHTLLVVKEIWVT